MFELDPKHASFDLFDDLIVRDVWRDKYALPDEKHPNDTFLRVANAIYDKDRKYAADAYKAMCKGLLMPGGRILAGAGTGTGVTMMNCYVAPNIEDSIEGIFETLKQSVVTLSRYGGIGMNFGTIRPKGAALNRVGLQAPGVLTFMEVWHQAAEAIQQAGHRRGAMMGVIPCTHPDLPDFIKAKHIKGKLTNFNVSVLITDAFMTAVKNDSDWVLHFEHPPTGVQAFDLKKYNVVNMTGEKDVTTYAYSIHKARDLWNDILRSTYEYSEPGVIFIDKINARNNLQYCETIACTNPCGEQPLPPNGTCNLAAVNLARMVIDPFTPNARFNYVLLQDVVKVAVRFLDNVIDVTTYPLEEQRLEEIHKRRLGLGISGLADTLAQLCIPYGHNWAKEFTDKVMREIATTAYITSAHLAQERGPFPLYDKKLREKGFAFRLCHHEPEVARLIDAYGLRNGVLLTIAPTGTTSILFGNISGGIEPVFAHNTKRTVWRADKTQHDYVSWGFGARFYMHCQGILFDITIPALPEYMNTAEQVTPKQHVQMQAAAQRWVDASVSKTINCPANMSFEDFQTCYMEAYRLDCKGCTTYRPSEVRGAVLKKVEDGMPVTPDGADIVVLLQEAIYTYKDGILTQMPHIMDCPEITDEYMAANPLPSEPLTPETFTKQKKRPRVIVGCTYKIIWPSLEAGVFLTVNEHNGRPWEIFIQSKDLRAVEWITGVAVFGSMLLQTGVDPMLVASQLKQIQGAHDQAWVDGKHWPSLPAYIGHTLEEHFKQYKTGTSAQDDATLSAGAQVRPLGEPITPEGGIFVNVACPKCSASMIYREGCTVCVSCGYSTCN